MNTNPSNVSGSLDWKAGIYGGLVGGLIFGAMMAMMGMLGMVAQVVRSESPLVGFLYHMFNSAVIGAFFVPVFGRLPRTRERGWSSASSTGSSGGSLGR